MSVCVYLHRKLECKEREEETDTEESNKKVALEWNGCCNNNTFIHPPVIKKTYRRRTNTVCNYKHLVYCIVPVTHSQSLFISLSVSMFHFAISTT